MAFKIKIANIKNLKTIKLTLINKIVNAKITKIRTLKIIISSIIIKKLLLNRKIEIRE